MRQPILIAVFVAVLAPCGLASADLDTAGNTNDVRRRQLELQVSRDQERIEELLSEPRDAEAAPLHRDDELQRLARRLPALQRELRHRIERDRVLRERAEREAASKTRRDEAGETPAETPPVPEAPAPPHVDERR